MTASKPPMRTLADRLTFAASEEGVSQNALESRLRLSRGTLNRYFTGKRGGTTVDVEKMKLIASELHVMAEWLVLGEGPMRRGGRGKTPAEEAMALARRSGTREEVLQSAWARYKDRESEMSALDWAVAFHSEEQLWGKKTRQSHEPVGTTAQPRRVDRRHGSSKPGQNDG